MQREKECVSVSEREMQRGKERQRNTDRENTDRKNTERNAERRK